MVVGTNVFAAHSRLGAVDQQALALNVAAVVPAGSDAVVLSEPHTAEDWWSVCDKAILAGAALSHDGNHISCDHLVESDSTSCW